MIGRKIVITNGAATSLPCYNGRIGTIIDVDADRVWVDSNEIEPAEFVGKPKRYYLLNNCYEFEEVINSPLWEALK